MLSLALVILASGPTMAGPSVAERGSSAATPAPFFNLLASDPATECSGAALTSAEGTSITHTNATTTRYCEPSDGSNAVAMTANQPRVSNLGILVEGSRTNLLIQNTAFDNVAWTKTNVTVTANAGTDPLGGSTAEKIVNAAGGGCFQSATAVVPSQTTGTASIWIFDGGSGSETPQIIIRDTSAGADRATCSLTTNGNGGWFRYSCNVSGMTGANNHVFKFCPAGAGTLNDNVSGLLIWGAQFEVPTGSFMTSTIPTAAASVTRANDVYTWSNGTDISAAGCLAATVTFGTTASFGGVTVPAVFGGSILSNGTEQMMATTDSTHVKMNDGTNTVSAVVSDLTGRTINIVTKWSGSTMTVVADGVTASGTFDGSFSSTATMRIGATAAGSGYANAWIDNIKAGSNPESCN